MNLDELSENRGEKLIHALINVSKPKEERPLGRVDNEYLGRFRKLGNDFMKHPFGWIGGKPVNWEECTYNGSRFQLSSQLITDQAKKQLTGKS